MNICGKIAFNVSCQINGQSVNQDLIANFHPSINQHILVTTIIPSNYATNSTVVLFSYRYFRGGFVERCVKSGCTFLKNDIPN